MIAPQALEHAMFVGLFVGSAFKLLHTYINGYLDSQRNRQEKKAS